MTNGEVFDYNFVSVDKNIALRLDSKIYTREQVRSLLKYALRAVDITLQREYEIERK